MSPGVDQIESFALWQHMKRATVAQSCEKGKGIQQDQNGNPIDIPHTFYLAC